jgi:hypothetical protein
MTTTELLQETITLQKKYKELYRQRELLGINETGVHVSESFFRQIARERNPVVKAQGQYLRASIHIEGIEFYSLFDMPQDIIKGYDLFKEEGAPCTNPPTV